MTLTELFTNIANAIRSATGATGKIKASDFAAKINAINYRGAWGTTINAGGSVTIPAGYHNGSGKVSAKSKTIDSMLIATSNSNTVTKSGRSGGDASQSTQVTFSASYISAIIACGSSKNDSGGTGGLNSSWAQPKVYATKEGTNSEVECSWNNTRKCYVVPDSNARYTKVRAYVYGFSGSEMVHAMIGCLYVFGN